MFDISPFVTEDDCRDEEAETRLDDLWISQDELEYLLKHASSAQAKAFYMQCINTLAEANEEGLCVSARCLQGETRNPWYTPPGQQ